MRLRQVGVINESILTYAFQTVARGWRTHEPEELELTTFVVSGSGPSDLNAFAIEHWLKISCRSVRRQSC